MKFCQVEFMRRKTATKSRQSELQQRRDVWVLVFPGFLLLDATGPIQVFATANDEARDKDRPQPYRIHLISLAGGAVTSSSGVAVLTRTLPRAATLAQATLVVSGGHTIDKVAADPSILRWLVRAQEKVARCCAVCNAALLFAQAGLLHQRRAVTHWKDIDVLKQAYPTTQVHDDAIYMRDGNVYTSAGVTAGIDLCLGLVEEDLGRQAALNVAKRLVVYHKRAGGQRQFSSELLAQASDGDVTERLLQWVKPRVHLQLDVDKMASAVAMSTRSLHRRLREESGLSPAQLLTRIRLDTACALLEGSKHSIAEVARKSGFASEYNLRRAFTLNFGVPPSEYRARFAGR
jgi:transcriptional regulator GlxA family with amidase domain